MKDEMIILGGDLNGGGYLSVQRQNNSRGGKGR